MMSHFVNNNTRMGFVCLFVQIQSFDQFNPPEPPQILDIYSIVVLQGVPKKLLECGEQYIVVSRFSSVFFWVSDKRRNERSKDSFILILQLSRTIFHQIRNKGYNCQIDV